MNRLPTEILPCIIQHVSRQDLVACTLVSRTFYVCTIPILWRFYIDHRHKNNECLSLLNRHHPMITYARKIKLVNRWTDPDLLRFMSLLVNTFVNDITIEEGYDLTDKSLQHLSQHWPHLTHIHLVGSSVTQFTMAAIANQCHHLESLELIDCKSLTSDMFAPFTTINKEQDGDTTTIRLCKLTLCSQLGLHPPWNHQTLIDLAQLPLTHIDFRGVSWQFMHDLLSCSKPWWCNLTSTQLKSIGRLGSDDQLFIQFLKCHGTLAHVSLQDSVMTDMTLEAMVKYLPRLKWLDLTRSNEVTFQGILCLVRHCSHLEFINLEQCNVMQWSFPRDIICQDDIVPYYGDVLRLTLQSINAIRHIGLQNDNDDNDDDDEYQVWLRTWKRSFANIAIHDNGGV